MAEDDDFLFDDDEPEGEGTEWVSNLDDDFDRLREASARSTDLYDDMEIGAAAGGGIGGFLSRLSPGQRLIIAVLFLLDVLVFGCGLLVVTGVITL